MEKSNLFFLLFILTNTLISQQLNNTNWKVYFGSSNPRDAKFSQDTMYFSNNGGISYTAAATYSTRGNLFKLIDLPQFPVPCGTDTGSYNFLIANDTLNFNTILDTCIGREITMSSSIWVKILTTNLDENSLINDNLTFYPNPVINNLTILNNQKSVRSNYQIFDSSGRIVLVGKIDSKGKVEVDLTNLQKGVYFLNQLDSNNPIQKIIKF